MSCILLQCKWPFGPLAFNKLIDWLMRVLLRLGSGKGVDVGRGKCPTFGRAGRCGHVSYRQTRRFHGRTESIIGRADGRDGSGMCAANVVHHTRPPTTTWLNIWCRREGDRRFGIALAVRHRLQWFIHLRTHGQRKRDEQPPSVHFSTLKRWVFDVVASGRRSRLKVAPESRPRHARRSIRPVIRYRRTLPLTINNDARRPPARALAPQPTTILHSFDEFAQRRADSWDWSAFSFDVLMFATQARRIDILSRMNGSSCFCVDGCVLLRSAWPRCLSVWPRISKTCTNLTNYSMHDACSHGSIVDNAIRYLVPGREWRNVCAQRQEWGVCSNGSPGAAGIP